MKKYCLYVLFIAVVTLIAVYSPSLNTLVGDSGWDYSYDSSDSWSGSDYSYSSDNDYNYNRNDNQQTYKPTTNETYSPRSSSNFIPTKEHKEGIDVYSIKVVLFIIVLIVAFVFLFRYILKKEEKELEDGNSPEMYYKVDRDKYKPIKENKIKEHIKDFNKNKFLKDAYQIIVDIQNAWMDFDYDKLRSLLTDELFNSYQSQLKALSKKKQKNVMHDFNLLDSEIVKINVNENEIALDVFMNVDFYDYIVDESNEVIRGDDSESDVHEYKLTFIRSIKKNNKKVCPSCGAKLKSKSSNKCPYCNSIVIFNNYDWVLSKKEIRK